MTVPVIEQPSSPPGPGVPFGAVLREQRVASGLTQEELAERSGLSVRAIRNVETGRTERPRPQSVDLLATALGLGELARGDLVRAARRGPVSPAEVWHVRMPGVSRCELPPDVPELTGRELAVAAVTRVLTAGQAPRLALVSGGPGVGKTAFVVHVAHRLRSRFPDGQFYADLDSSDGHDLSPHAVLGRVLRSLGATDLPASLEERAALLRAGLARKRVLVVLDNVDSEAQVRPLLTGSSRSALLLASRQQLVALPGGHLVRLVALGADAAVGMLARLVGAVRVRGEAGPALAIAESCARLPLALHVAASWLRARPGRRLADLADLLADSAGVLDRLAVGDLSVRASIAAYDRELRPEERRLAHQLALLDQDRWQWTDLCRRSGLSEVSVRDGLDRLAHANLLLPGTGYRLDPLLRQHFLAQTDAVVPLRMAR